MTSRERVLAAFEHQEADRVPAWCGSSPEFWEKAKRATKLDDEQLRLRFGNDFRRVFAVYNGPQFALAPGVTSRTPFGIEREGVGYGQPKSHPLASATLAEVHSFPWPEPRWMEVSGIRAQAEQQQRQYAILGGDWSAFFHDAVDLAGMDVLFLKMYDEPEFVDAVFQHIVDYYADVSQRIFDAAASSIDIFFIRSRRSRGQTGRFVVFPYRLPWRQADTPRLDQGTLRPAPVPLSRPPESNSGSHLGGAEL